jgi:hypothetical protein
LSYVLSIEHTTGLPIRTYIALYPICPLPYLRTAYTPIPARDSLPTKLISTPKVSIRSYYVLTVIAYRYSFRSRLKLIEDLEELKL